MSAVDATTSGTDGKTENEAASRARRPLSGDGIWWWNGRRWIPAITEDGLWRWNGSRWTPSVDLEGKRPEDLAGNLTFLAEDRYEAAGAILASRAPEWEPEGSLRQLAGQAREADARLQRLLESVGAADNGQVRGGVLGRRGSLGGDRRHLEEELEAVRRDHRSLCVRLARSAPQPSVKDADDVLVSARLLDERAAMLTAGLAEVDEAEHMRADAAVVAQRELASSQDTRLRALQDARRAVETAQSDHAWAVSEARVNLRTVLTPGPGELKAGLGPLRLFANLLETPAGRMPAAGATAFAGTGAALWGEHRQALSDLVLLEAADAGSFRDALTEGASTMFLLVVGRTATSLWPVPPGQEKAAQRFARLVDEHAREGAEAQEQRDREAREAEAGLETVTGDNSSIEAAEAELARVEADAALLGAIDDARQRLERARAETPELVEARRKVLEIARKLTAPPEPLKSVE